MSSVFKLEVSVGKDRNIHSKMTSCLICRWKILNCNIGTPLCICVVGVVIHDGDSRESAFCGRFISRSDGAASP